MRRVGQGGGRERGEGARTCSKERERVLYMMRVGRRDRMCDLCVGSEVLATAGHRLDPFGSLLSALSRFRDSLDRRAHRPICL